MDIPSEERMLKTLREFRDHNITLVEWETPLLRRLGYPLTEKPDLLFLVPDQQIQEARDIANANGLLESDRPRSYLAEQTQMCFRFAYGPHNYRFVMLPLSWTGIKEQELVTVKIRTLPCPIWTVPIPAFCAAYLRIIMRAKPGGRIYFMATADLLGVITYSMFDMSYEGSYMPKPEDDNYVVDEEKDALEMENAIKTIKAWNFSEDTEWARDIMLQLVSGTLQYESLPGMRGASISQE